MYMSVFERECLSVRMYICMCMRMCEREREEREREERERVKYVQLLKTKTIPKW